MSVAPATPLLVAIDLQEIFADPESGWWTPRFDEVLEPVDRLVASYPEVVFTRFVAPARPEGSWVEYYGRWPFALVAEDDPLYRVIDRYDALDAPRLAAPTFSKWEVLAPFAPAGRILVLCGVATDCCVVSTALSAADAGARVRVVREACAGVDDAAHERALTLMAGYAPLVEIVSLDEALALASGAAPEPG